MRLIAEDLMLLLLRDDKGTLDASYPQPTLGGALLEELAVTGAVRLEKKSVWRSGKVLGVPGASVDDPVLRAALATVAEKERTAEDLVNRLGKDLRDVLAERLVTRGDLREERTRVLGLFPRKRWPAADTTRETEVRRDLTAALVHGVTPAPRTEALAALLHALDKPHKVVDRQGLPAREVRRRAKGLAEGHWAAKAVRDAIASASSSAASASS
ncbi:GPP34 family phosphoprotein [Nocardioides sp. GCM10027113]|uniref:GOLPH3/VPS74 family protein n=1 Tax=unclassified Nocardioides TaxID=2615069 RepID=UPI00360FFF4C